MESLLEPVWTNLMEKINEVFSKGFTVWTLVGFLGAVMFFSRFFVQWIASERRKESVIPISFWYLSIVGSLLLLAYSLHKADIVFISMYIANCLIYFRNLQFIYKKRPMENA